MFGRLSRKNIELIERQWFAREILLDLGIEDYTQEQQDIVTAKLCTYRRQTIRKWDSREAWAVTQMMMNPAPEARQ